MDHQDVKNIKVSRGALIVTLHSPELDCGEIRELIEGHSRVTSSGIAKFRYDMGPKHYVITLEVTLEEDTSPKERRDLRRLLSRQLRSSAF